MFDSTHVKGPGQSSRKDAPTGAKKPLESIIYKSLKSWVPRLDDDLPNNLYQTVIQSVERPLIKLALEQAHGNQCRAARILGINRNTLRKKISDLGLND